MLRFISSSPPRCSGMRYEALSLPCLTYPLRCRASGILVFASALLFAMAGAASAQTALKIGDAFPKITLTDLKGGAAVTLPDAAEGKIAIIHFWASWCPLCIREMDAIESVQNDNREKGLLSYSIDVGESAEVAAAYVQKTKATYSILLDPASTAAKQCAVNSIPTTFICDGKGIIRFKIMGEVSRVGLEKLVSTLLR